MENITGFVTLPGARIYYEMAGEGEALVLLHGGFVDCRMWDDQFSFFANQYRVVRYDMRSAGKTDTEPSSEPYSHAHDCYHFLKALTLPSVTLVGLSLGAGTAIDFALTYPSLVQRLVLISPTISGYRFQDPWLISHYTKMLTALNEKDLTTAIEEQLSVLTDGPFRTPTQVDSEMRTRMHVMIAHAFPVSRLAPNTTTLEPPALHRLAELCAPTVVILGNKDMSDTLTMGHLLHRQVIGSELIILPDVGHTLVMEQPNEVNHRIDSWLHQTDRHDVL